MDRLHPLRPIPAQIQTHLELQNRFEAFENCLNVDDLNNKVVDTVRTVGSKYFKTRHTRMKKLSDETFQHMGQRRKMRLQDSKDASR